MFGAGSDSSTDIAAIGNGDNTKYFTGGLKFGTFNRTQFGQTPEYQARMGWRWTNPGYDTTTWTFIPIWATGDTSVRWIGDPNVRWPELYAADVNSTTATVGTLNVTTCNGCSGAVSSVFGRTGAVTAQTGDYSYSQIGGTVPATHLVSGTMQGPTSPITGTGSTAALYSVTLPAGTFSVGTGIKCFARVRHTTGSATVTVGWKLGSTDLHLSHYLHHRQQRRRRFHRDIHLLVPDCADRECPLGRVRRHNRIALQRLGVDREPRQRRHPFLHLQRRHHRQDDRRQLLLPDHPVIDSIGRSDEGAGL